MVLGLAVIGAAMARLEPRRMASAMFATAGAQALIGLTAFLGGLPGAPLLDVWFIAMWAASALLFRQASIASSPAQ